ncbi:MULTISPECIES: cytochrome bd oxidase small subunit CydS [Oceanobacillus]
MLNQFLIFIAPFIVLIAAIVLAFVAAAKDR